MISMTCPAPTRPPTYLSCRVFATRDAGLLPIKHACMQRTQHLFGLLYVAHPVCVTLRLALTSCVTLWLALTSSPASICTVFAAPS